jgi:hypothetical protein
MTRAGFRSKTAAACYSPITYPENPAKLQKRWVIKADDGFMPRCNRHAPADIPSQNGSFASFVCGTLGT